MNCNEFGFLLESRRDGALEEREERALSAHLEACSACRAEEAAIAAADAAFRMLRAMEPPVDIAAAVSRRIAREAPAESYRGLFWGALALATVLAALLWRAGFTPAVIWGDAPLAALLRPLNAMVLGWWEPVRIALGAVSPLLTVLAPVALTLTLLETALAGLFVVRRAANVS